MTQFMPKLGYISSCESTLDNVRERVFLVQDNTLNLSINGDLDASINLQCIVDRPLDTILVQAGACAKSLNPFYSKRV